MRYYHGSFTDMPIGFSLLPNPSGYTAAQEVSSLEALFERLRPSDKISRLSCVFVCFSVDDVDACGAYSDFIYQVDPQTPVQRSDLAWYSHAQCLIEDDASQELIEAAVFNYWQGTPFIDALSSVFEGRCLSATVSRLL